LLHYLGFMQYEITPADELQWRISRFQVKIREAGIPGALINQNTDLFYFAGNIQRSFLFIPSEGEAVLAVTGNLERAKEECRLKNIVPLKNTGQLGDVLKEFGYYMKGRIGLEMDILPASYYLSFKNNFKEADFTDVSELIKQTRMIKSEYEQERIRQSCKILDEVMELAANTIKEGMTELELDAVLTAYTRRKGHMGFFRARAYNQDMNYCHVLFGRASALSSYVKGPLGGKGTTPAIPLGAGFSTLVKDQPIIVDYGMGYQGYVSDSTRTFVLGKLPAELERAFEVTREVKYLTESRVKPGKCPADLYNEIIELVRKRGYEDNFMGYKENRVLFIGHGIGLEIDEYPIIAPMFKLEFAPGMVYSLEPKMAFPEIGAVGIEDDFLVTADGVERLTNSPDNIIAVKP
jgi:Xaa-Pro dipeptidase